MLSTLHKLSFEKVKTIVSEIVFFFWFIPVVSYFDSISNRWHISNIYLVLKNDMIRSPQIFISWSGDLIALTASLLPLLWYCFKFFFSHWDKKLILNQWWWQRYKYKLVQTSANKLSDGRNVVEYQFIINTFVFFLHQHSPCRVRVLPNIPWLIMSLKDVH